MYERVFKPSIVSKRAGIDRRDDGLSLFGRGSIPNAIAKKSVNAGRHWDMMTAVLGFVRYTPGCECECVTLVRFFFVGFFWMRFTHFLSIFTYFFSLLHIIYRISSLSF